MKNQKGILLIILMVIFSILLGISIKNKTSNKNSLTDFSNKNSITINTENSNVEKNGFNIILLDEKITLPLSLNTLLQYGFTFTDSSVAEQLYKSRNADDQFVLENRNFKELKDDGMSKFVVITSGNKKINSFDNTSIINIRVSYVDKNVFSINGFGCGDKIDSLITAYGNNYVIFEGTYNENINKGLFMIKYSYGSQFLLISSLDGKIVSMTIGYNEDE